MRNRALAAALAAALSCGAATAADADGHYFIMGDVGAMKCVEVNAKRDDFATGATIGAWAGGYLTALNRLTPKTYNVAPDPAAFLTGLYDQCAANPQMHLEPAAWEVAKALYPARVQTKP